MTTYLDPLPHPFEHDGWRSDYVLSDQSAREFRALHRTVSVSLDQLDSEIAHVQAVLDNLLHERAICVSRIDKINSAIAPHKKLPAEILSEVFKYTFYHPIIINLERNAFRVLHMAFAPQVCRRWKQVALNTRIFWDAIQMACVIDDFEYDDDAISTANAILSRSSGSITLRLVDRRHSWLVRDHKNISIPALIHTISLAKHISLSTSSSQLLHDILQVSPIFFPVLESVHLSTSGGRKSDIEKCCVFNNAPHLVEVCLADMKEFALISLPTFELPWAQLQNISILSPIAISYIHFILSRCTRLVSCMLRISSHPGEAPVPGPLFPRGSITFPYLRILNLYRDSEPPAGDSAECPTTRVVDPLVLPSLTTLQVSPVTDNIWCTSVIDLLHRSKCCLEKFVADTRMLAVPEVVLETLFEIISPLLLVLEISFVRFTVGMLARISRGALFPRLQVLDCAIERSPASLEDLMDLMRRRCLGNAAEAASYIDFVRVHCDRNDRPSHDVGFAEWTDVFNRFCVLVAEISQQRRIVLFQSF